MAGRQGADNEQLVLSLIAVAGFKSELLKDASAQYRFLEAAIQPVTNLARNGPRLVLDDPQGAGFTRSQLKERARFAIHIEHIVYQHLARAVFEDLSPAMDPIDVGVSIEGGHAIL